MDSKETSATEHAAEKKYPISLSRHIAEQLNEELHREIQQETQANDGSYKTARGVATLQEEFARALSVAQRPEDPVKVNLGPIDIEILKSSPDKGEDAGLKEVGDRIARQEIMKNIEADYRQAKTFGGIRRFFNKISGLGKVQS